MVSSWVFLAMGGKLPPELGFLVGSKACGQPCLQYLAICYSVSSWDQITPAKPNMKKLSLITTTLALVFLVTPTVYASTPCTLDSQLLQQFPALVGRQLDCRHPSPSQPVFHDPDLVQPSSSPAPAIGTMSPDPVSTTTNFTITLLDSSSTDATDITTSSTSAQEVLMIQLIDLLRQLITLRQQGL